MSKLILVPSPIGNLEDITIRSLNVLKTADAILAEDTRVSAKLLAHFEIKKPLLSNHSHNEHQMLEKILERLKNGEQLAMLSDAGTPGISDPGFLLVRACINAGITVETLPGPTAFVPALVNSGLPCDKFVFEGFLPQKKGRQTRLLKLQEEERTIVFYESPYRLLKTLQQFVEFYGADRKVCVSRELSKLFEENIRGTLREVIAYYETHTLKGEIVIVLEGNQKSSEEKREEKKDEKMNKKRLNQ